MKKVYALLLLSLIFIDLKAQVFQWAKREGLYAYDYGYGVTTDGSGNVYIAGKYEENADFSGDILPCAGNHDIYVARYNSTGTLDWIRTAGGPLGDYAHAIECDGTFLYVSGEIEGPQDTILFPGSTIKLITRSANDAYVSKYDLSGNLLWAQSAGAYQDDKAQAVAYDKDGNVYMAGFFNDTAYFGATRIIGNLGANDMFVAKYDKDGNFLWVRQAGGPGRDEAKGLKCDAAGNVYVCGLHSDNCVFGSTTLSSPGFFNAFVAQYSPNGTLNWVKSDGGAYDDVAWAMTMDKAGMIYISGEFNGYANFGGIYLTTAGQAQAYVACYNSSGAVQWATAAGCKTGTGALVTRARGIGTDGTDLYITGQFGGTASFGSVNLTAVDSSDIFMAKINSSGVFVWATAVTGPADAYEPLGYESGNSICAEPSGNVFATGSLLSGGNFGTGLILPYDRTDVFLAKINQGSSGVQESSSLKEVSIYPNPGTGAFVVDLPSSDKKTEITIYNCLAQIIEKRIEQSNSKINFDLSAEQKGIYFLEIRNEDQTIMKKIVLQ